MAHGTISLSNELRSALREAIVEHFGSVVGIAECVAKLRKHRKSKRRAETVGKASWQEESVDKIGIENIASQIRRFLREDTHNTSRNLPPAFLRDFREVFGDWAPPISVDHLLKLPPRERDFGGSADDVPHSLQRLIDLREATKKSLSCSPKLVDSIHRFALLHRIDQLDYPTKDFFSLRRLAGKNAGKLSSSFILYYECSENKLRFQDMDVRALDLKTGECLRVEPENPAGGLAFEHPFRIFFRKPLKPEEDFDIVYCIRLPRELEVIPAEDEIMSVSLRRMALPLEKLIFEVCLSFKPVSFVPACLFGNQKLVVPSNVELNEGAYQQKEPWERNMGLKKWSCKKPWKISLTVENPEAAVYIINYKR